MSRELLIMRHGKSDWDVDADDFHRPLKKRGKRASQRVAIWLRQQQLLPDLILCSPALRALHTAQYACDAMELDREAVNSNERIYLASCSNLLQVLGECPTHAHRIMIVGHNPGLEELLTFLSHVPVEVPDDGKLLPTATLARLEMPVSWEALPPGTGKLLDLIRPSSLPR